MWCIFLSLHQKRKTASMEKNVTGQFNIFPCNSSEKFKSQNYIRNLEACVNLDVIFLERSVCRQGKKKKSLSVIQEIKTGYTCTLTNKC